MRAKTILAILFLFSVALAGILIIRAMPHDVDAAVASTPKEKEIVKEEILVAAASVVAGTLLRAQDVRWAEREGDVQAGDILRPTAEARAAKPETDDAARAVVYGAALRTTLAAGDRITTTKIVKPGDRDFLPTVLAQGMRAITVPISSAAGATGLMFPGDHVDVILTQSFKNDDAPLTRRSVSETVVENLRVLAIDAAKAPGGSGLTVTLQVTPAQAETVNVAQELGKLSLTLRSEMTADGNEAVRPTWAGDVSPALRAATPPAKVVQSEKPSVKVMRGNKSEEFKPQ